MKRFNWPALVKKYGEGVFDGKPEILISMRPAEACELLNNKCRMIIKNFVPQNYIGWVNVYVSKEKTALYDKFIKPNVPNIYNEYFLDSDGYAKPPALSGKVVFRFWYEEYEPLTIRVPLSLTKIQPKITYAWFVKDLKVFDRPRELRHFYQYVRAYMKHEPAEDFVKVDVANAPRRIAWVYPKSQL